MTCVSETVPLTLFAGMTGSLNAAGGRVLTFPCCPNNRRLGFCQFSFACLVSCISNPFKESLLRVKPSEPKARLLWLDVGRQ